ncbi:CBM21 domain-containing protein [Geomonas sp. Red32]|uniref:CBM21 domain-containing protein n=1 Tax=Geomonas sp. Red32 TaxID=2912856 RepID=UPI00202CAE2B|nr:CBM21 domain-containing protein [Geomonas sp. Red32]MCM0084414.1 CBM21 domain-containing protein [Geomonas sp. Red32]
MGQSAIRLKYVESDTFSPGGGITGVNNTIVAAKVENLAFAKDVALHYQQQNGTWSEVPLTWQKNFNDYDNFILNDDQIYIKRFALRYSVDGVTFWDNNGGADYRFDEIHPNTVGGNVVLNLATAHRGTEAGGGFVFTTSWVDGEIYLNNLSFNKKAGIRLTANDWGSFEDTFASFAETVPVAEGISEVEVWKFKSPELNLDESTPGFKFAIFYTDLDSGETFWDNNFGRDYTLSKADLSTDQ